MVKLPAYPTLDGLFDLACRDGVDIRPTLLRVLTDLYVQKPAHTAAEETQYVELALGLIDVVDAPTRAAVAGKLRAYPGAPFAIRQRLAEHGAAPTTTVADARPEAAPVTSDWPSLARSREIVELFFAANTGDRRLILSNLELLREPPAVPRVTDETIRELEVAALQRRTGEFSRLLARALGINSALAERITRDHSGEPVAIVAKAIGMPSPVLHRTLLLLNPAVGQSIERFNNLSQLFAELAPATAERMVAIWRQAGGMRRAAHATLFWDDDRRGARAPAIPRRYAQPRRDASRTPRLWNRARA
jgi:hypothetical protein